MDHSWIILFLAVICLAKLMSADVMTEQSNPNEFVFNAKQSIQMKGCGGDQVENVQPTSTVVPTPSCEQELDATIQDFESEIAKLNRQWYDFLIAMNGKNITQEFYNLTIAYMSELSQFNKDLPSWFAAVETLACSDQITAINAKIDEVINFKNDMPDISTTRQISIASSSSTGPLITKVTVQPGATTPKPQEVTIITTPQQKTIGFGEFSFNCDSFTYELQDGDQE
ncbi:unnamed protein product [Meganyctiphanes norvegica]|uniref:Uncharacterized protein n=1 Tax=Meganyctiphanes norvegica TaxID=48144 RepID=A0AAV2RE86_MEGNR